MFLYKGCEFINIMTACTLFTNHYGNHLSDGEPILDPLIELWQDTLLTDNIFFLVCCMNHLSTNNMVLDTVGVIVQPLHSAL